jgi:hypothetical protein
MHKGTRRRPALGAVRRRGKIQRFPVFHLVDP